MNSLTVIKSPRLTLAQKELYNLVCQKIESNTKLVFEEVKRIYLGFVNRNMINNIPHRYDYWVPVFDVKGNKIQGQYTSRLIPMTEEEITFNTLTWLTQNLGLLILKGYLTVIPAVDLRLI